MKNKKNQIRNLSYTSIDYDIDVIKYKLRMLEMDKLINHLFLDEDESEYILVEKMITFADVPTFAKWLACASSWQTVAYMSLYLSCP